MLEAKGLDAKIWDEAMNVDDHIQKKIPHSFVKGNTPFEFYFGHKPDMSNFKVFGSTITWARIPLDKRKYLQLKSIECLLIGYTEESNGFKLLNIRTK